MANEYDKVVNLDSYRRSIRGIPTEALKDMWDRWGGVDAIDGFEGEDIHAELNRRGEGAYCVV